MNHYGWKSWYYDSTYYRKRVRREKVKAARRANVARMRRERRT